MFQQILKVACVIAFATAWTEDTPKTVPLVYQQDRPCSPDELAAVALAARLEGEQLKGDLRSKRIAQLKRSTAPPQIRYVVVTRERQCAQTELKLSMLGAEYEAATLRNELLKKQLDLIANELMEEKKSRAKEQASAAADIGHLNTQLQITNMQVASRGVQLEEVRRQLTLVQKHDAKGRGWKSALKRLFGRRVKQ